jgi:hypothetical protein
MLAIAAYVRTNSGAKTIMPMMIAVMLMDDLLFEIAGEAQMSGWV